MAWAKALSIFKRKPKKNAVKRSTINPAKKTETKEETKTEKNKYELPR